MENSYDEECFKKWEIDECEAEMEKVVQWIGKRKLHGRVRVAFIEESYERQGYRMGIPKQVYVSRVVLCQEKVQIKYNQFSLFM